MNYLSNITLVCNLSFQDGGFVIGAPVNEVGRGSVYYSTSADIDSFMSGRNRLPDNITGVDDETIRDQYQGQGFI